MPVRTALVIVITSINHDPRVKRQVDWLLESGWTVDTVAGGDPAPGVRDHFRLSDPAGWQRLPFASLFIHALLPRRARFRRLVRDRIDPEARRRVRQAQYSLIVFNDHHFLPWVDDADFARVAEDGHLHLDMHEYVRPRAPRDSLWRSLASPYFDWIRSFIGHRRFRTRSTVAQGIADLYAAEFDIDPLTVIRNAPRFVDLVPRPVAPDRIRLVHHGAGNAHRGIREMLDTMRLVDDRFELTLMLVGPRERIDAFRASAEDLGDRVIFRDPVPMQAIPHAINEYDLEIMFFPPHTRNLEFALPNKLFEAVQGRLGLVIGESSAMVELVVRYGNGVVVPGWEPTDLARTLNALDADRVAKFKAASHASAEELNAEKERDVFLEQLPTSSSQS